MARKKKLTLALLASMFLTTYVAGWVRQFLTLNYPQINSLLVDAIAAVIAFIIVYYLWRELKIPED